MQKTDERISIWIQRKGIKLPALWQVASKYGLYTYTTAILVIAYFITDKFRIIPVILPVIFTMALTLLLQRLFRRPRPVVFKTDYKLWVTTYSFPSVHSSVSFSFATSLSLLFLSTSLEYIWIYILAFFVIACLIAISRIMIGVHYAFDVLVGSLLGVLISVSFYLLQVI